MDEHRCPKCGCIAYPDESTCDECGAPLSRQTRLSPYERSRAGADGRDIWRAVWPLSLLAIALLFRERVVALLTIRWVVLVLAAAILAFGLPWAWKSRRPRISYVLVVGSVLVLVEVWLRPAFLRPWIPSMLPVVLVLIIGLVLPEAPTFRDPQSFKIGLVMIAVPVGTLWPLHTWIAHLELGFREYNLALHAVALFFAFSSFAGGLWFLSEADRSRG